MSHWKKNWTRLVSPLFRKFGRCFGLFEIEDQTQYMYIVGKYNKHLCLLQNMTEMLPKDSLFYLSLKIVQINYIFFNNIRIFIRLKSKPNSVRIRFLRWQFFLFSLDGIQTHTFDTITWQDAYVQCPQTTQPHPLYIHTVESSYLKLR
jgi:hypothetical protein